MNYKNRKIMEVAQQFGYITVRDFANFLRIYNPSIQRNESGREFMYLSLF